VGDHHGYVDWAAIVGGAVFASAISLLFLSFGTALGLSLTSVRTGTGASLAAFMVAAALWLMWVEVSGFFAGGYLAGRLRRRVHDATEDESDVRDGSHGLIVWSLGMLLGAFLAFSGVSAVLSSSSAVVGAGASATAAAIKGSSELLIDRALRPMAVTAQSPDPRPEITRILANATVAGTFDKTDHDYLVSALSGRLGLTPEDAGKRVDQLWQQAQQAKQEVAAAAEKARKWTLIAAFINAVTMLISAAAAYYGAVLGGNHRDSRTVIRGWSHRWA
jgi:hypothetical protein